MSDKPNAFLKSLAPAAKELPSREIADLESLAFREWLESKAPDHHWPMPITAIVFAANECFCRGPSAGEVK